MSRRVEFTPSYILHSRPYRETSVLLDVFTELHGQVSLIAKGIRTSKSKKKGLLQPFNPLLLSWYIGNSDLFTMTGCEQFSRPAILSGPQLIAGLYINELLVQLLHRHDPHPTIFKNYQILIESLNQASSRISLEKKLRYFEKRLLDELGYGLHFEVEGGLKINPDEYYSYNTDSILRPSTGNEKEVAILGKHLLAFANHKLECESDLKFAKRITRMALSRHLKKPLLNSRLLWQ